MFQAFPIPAAARPWLSGTVHATLPGGDYLLPAMLQPMLLFILQGSIAMQHDDGHWQMLTAAGLCGATASIRRSRASAGTRIIACGIPPAALPSLLGLAASEAFEHYLPLDALLPARWRPAWLTDSADGSEPAITDRLPGWLAGLADRHPCPKAALPLPAHWQQHDATQLAQVCGLSLRQFERRFRHCHGQSWRAYRHQHRCQQLLLQLCGQAVPPHWAALAADLGYSDQAHLHRDLLRFTGYTPGRFARAWQQQDPALWLYRPAPQLLAPLLGDGSDQDVVSLQDRG